MANAKFTQDMPPKGGYNPINFGRIPAKQVLSTPSLFLGYVGLTTFGLYLFGVNYKRIKYMNIEMQDTKIALEPLLLAERDRFFLKQLRKNRDDEAELMKDVPGWIPGTYYGEKIYKTVDKDEIVDPIIQEYYAHARDKDLFSQFHAHFWN